MPRTLLIARGVWLPAAAVLFCVGGGVGAWRLLYYQSSAGRGVAALQEAYRLQRPLEARLAGFVYAPFPRTRGEEDRNAVNYLQRDRAERLLLDAASEEPSPTAHHALGQLYLVERQYDKAIDQFQTAIKMEPSKAAYRADLGAALLERAKAELTSDTSGKAIATLAHTLEHLDKALEQEGSLREALFNRALCYETMVLPEQAGQDWKKYLRMDAGSSWTEEARQHLKTLEETKKREPKSPDQLLADFIHAYQQRDDWSLSEAFRLSYYAHGNFVAERLLQEYLSLSTLGKIEAANHTLDMLSYAGRLEGLQTGDRFHSDLVAYYASIRPAQWASLIRARTLMKEAHLLFDRFDTTAAAKIYMEAKRLFDATGDWCESLFVEMRLGQCYYSAYKLDQNQAVVRHLLPEAVSKGYTRLLQQALIQSSSLHYNFRDYSLAIADERRALELAEKLEIPNSILLTLSGLLEYCRYLGNYSQSLYYIQRSLPAIRPQVLEPLRIAVHYVFVSQALGSAGYYEAAVAYQQEALPLAREIGDIALLAHSHTNLALLYARQQKMPDALRNVLLALEIAQSKPNDAISPQLIAYCYLQAGHVYRQAADYGNAVSSYSESIQRYKELNLPLFLYQGHKGKLLCFIAQGNDELARQEIRSAMDIAESNRAKILEGDNRNSFYDVEQSLYDLAIEFQYSRMHDAEQAFGHSEASRSRSLMDMLNAGTQAPLRDNASDVSFQSVTPPLALAEIQRRLSDGVILLQYAVLDRRLLIWVVDRRTLRVAEQPITETELDRLVSAFLSKISASSGDAGEEPINEGTRLRDLLIGPVESWLPKKATVYVIPDKMLYALPFPALRSSKTQRYLVEDYVLAMAPSASVFALCTDLAVKKQPVALESVLSVGNPRLDPGQYSDLPTLTSATGEAQEVAGYYDSALVLVEGQASSPRVKSEMAGFHVLHLALHSVIDDRSPLRSKLVLAKDKEGIGHVEDQSGTIQAYELYAMKLPKTRLAVLSACQTGAERYFRGEGMISIARPFIAAGVPLVVASLWPVDSDATAGLMIHFHELRKRGHLSTVEALRQAQLDMLKGSDERLHRPYYWAPFVLIGGHANF